MNSTVYNSLSTRRASQRFQWAFQIYVLSVFINEVLTINLGLFYFRPEKIGILLGIALTLRYCKVVFSTSKRASFLLLSWAIYNLWWGCSAFWSIDRYPSILNQFNVLFMHLADTLFVFGMIGALITSRSFVPLIRSMRLFVIIAFLEILSGSLDYIAGHRVIHSGVRAADYTYGIGIFGFHAERLYFAEYLVIANSVCLGLRNCSLVWRLLRWLIVILTPVFLSLILSYTGIVVYLLFMGWYFLRNATMKNRLICVGLLLAFVFVVPKIYNQFTPEIVKQMRTKKFEKRDQDSSDTWRYLATTILIDETMRHPSLVGHGYFSTEMILDDQLGKRSTPHTIISIPYEQGVIGVLIAVVLFSQLMIAFFNKTLQGDRNCILPNDVRLFVLGVSCCALGRMLFYYQVRNYYVYVLAVLLLSKVLCSNPRDMVASLL